MSIYTVVVHHPLAHPVRLGPIRPDPEVGGCPRLTQGIPSLSILDQLINFTQNVLLLHQVEVFRYLGIHCDKVWYHGYPTN
jgi:hypothetical protein